MLLAEHFVERITKAMKDDEITPGARDRLQRLWDNYELLKGYVDRPRGTFETYREKYRDLMTTRDDIIGDMSRLDGVEPIELDAR